MRPDSRPVNITLNLPSLPDEAVVEIQDFLYEILDLFMTPPITITVRDHRNIKSRDHTHTAPRRAHT